MLLPHEKNNWTAEDRKLISMQARLTHMIFS